MTHKQEHGIFCNPKKIRYMNTSVLFDDIMCVLQTDSKEYKQYTWRTGASKIPPRINRFGDSLNSVNLTKFS